MSRVLDGSVLGPDYAAVSEADPFRQEARAWLAQHVPQTDEPSDLDETFEFRRAWERTLFAHGWAGPAWPKAYGGRGAGPLQHFMFYEELALARAPMPLNNPGIALLGPTLMRHGTDELKERFLPGILSADDVWCQGFSEPDSGSDLASVRTKARLDGDEWVIEGQKVWTTWAKYADWCFVLCRTDPESTRHRGLTMILCPMDQPGIDSRPIVQITGDAEFGEVFFDGARAPRGLTLGPEGAGWDASMTMFEYERADMGFTNHARQLVQLHDAKQVLLARASSLSPVVRETLRLRLAELWMRAQQLRRLNLNAALRAEDGESVGMRGSVTKIVWSSLEQETCAFLADVNGIAGLTSPGKLSHDLMASRAASIYSGTGEIQRNIVAERLLGLPR